MKKKKKIAVFSDLHCGNLLGLTPRSWLRESFPLNDLMLDFWNWFKRETKDEKFDIAIWNGDLVDGEGRADSAFHLTTDINQQIEMASEIIDVVGAKQNIFTHGTSYHTGRLLDYEKLIADKYGGNIKAKQKLSINGVRFDISHTVGKTSTPVGGDIMRKKAMVWSFLQDLLNGNPYADYVIRSHVHEYGKVENEYCCVITTPALEIGSREYNRYVRKMEQSWYTVGFLIFEIDDENNHHMYRKSFKYQLPEDKYIEC